MKTIKLIIPAIRCKHCVHTIKMELEELAGVSEVQVNLDDKEVGVTFESPANETQIRDLLIEINYPPEK